MADLKECNGDIPAFDAECHPDLKGFNPKDHGFEGKPVIAEKYVNKNYRETGDREHDIDAGNIAYKINGRIVKSPNVGDIYFRQNFVKVEDNGGK